MSRPERPAPKRQKRERKARWTTEAWPAYVKQDSNGDMWLFVISHAVTFKRLPPARARGKK